MDTVTHGILGALIAKAFFAEDLPYSARAQVQSWREPPATTGRVAIIATTLGAIFPDIDIFAGPLAHNALSIMTWHRTITHSIILLPLWAVLLAFLTHWGAQRLRWPAPAMGNLITFYALGLASHIFLDLITSFGTMALSPLNYTRFSLDWIFIVDLIMTSFVLLPQLAAWAFRRPQHSARRAIPLWALCSAAAFTVSALVRRMNIPFPTAAAAACSGVFAIFFLLPLRNGAGTRASRAKWCRIGVALATGYLAFAATMHNSALGHVRQFAGDAGLHYQNIAALPLPPTPALWAGLIATGDSVYRLQFSEIGDSLVTIQVFGNSPNNSYITAARALPDVQTFLWFARFPVFQYLERDGRPVVQISDLRFYGTNRPTGAAPGTPVTNFTFEVVFTPDGKVVSHGLMRDN